MKYAPYLFSYFEREPSMLCYYVRIPFFRLELLSNLDWIQREKEFYLVSFL